MSKRYVYSYARPRNGIELTVLNYCNKVRVEHLKLSPRKCLSRGIKGNAYYCPVARTIGGNKNDWVTGAYVGIGDVHLHGSIKGTIPIPFEVMTFIHMFDAGEMTWLEAGR